MIKAYEIYFDEGGGWLITDHVSNVVAECINFDTDEQYFTEEEIESLFVGSKINKGPWIVECLEVEEGYIESLPEHDGW